MRLGTRIFFCYLIIFIICFSYPIKWVLDNLRTRYLEGVEEPLVDQANILAVSAGREMEANQFDPDKWYQTFAEASSRPLTAQIYHLVKTNVDMRMYITDASGKIIFDSNNRQNIGADYSSWRDVHLTLQGKYGARTTAENREDPSSKLFDKFFSLQRPDSGEKSTGLGLNFVKEVAILHNGDIKLENRSKKGVRATLTLPL